MWSSIWLHRGSALQREVDFNAATQRCRVSPQMFSRWRIAVDWHRWAPFTVVLLKTNPSSLRRSCTVFINRGQIKWKQALLASFKARSAMETRRAVVTSVGDQSYCSLEDCLDCRCVCVYFNSPVWSGHCRHITTVFEGSIVSRDQCTAEWCWV